MEKRVSEQIKAFLDFVDECSELNAMAYSGVGEEDKRHQDLIHAIEFENNPDKIAQIGMRLHQHRIERRVYKDLYEITDPVVQFFNKALYPYTTSLPASSAQDNCNNYGKQRMSQRAGSILFRP